MRPELKLLLTRCVGNWEVVCQDIFCLVVKLQQHVLLLLQALTRNGDGTPS